MLKLLDKFLGLLKTDRNTFFTYILSLLTVYFLVDRIVEFLFIVFTGVAYIYWSPIMYTIALACCAFAFAFSMGSKFVKNDDDKVTWFYRFAISFYILVVLMFTEWINKVLWIGFISVPNFTGIVTQFSFLVRPAFSSLALALPLCTVGMIFKKLFFNVYDSQLIIDSIYDYEGINLNDKTKGWGQFTNELYLGTEKEDGKKVKLAEIRRYESTLVVGVSGTGKTTLVFEPWIAQDINKKYLYRENAKNMAFAALRTGIATLNAPYDNDYINNNFSLNMILPSESKRSAFSSYFKKMILNESGSNITYRDLGLTYIAPDDETVEKIKKVCAAHELGYYLIDPSSSDSMGINPFSFTSPLQAATAISSILGGFYTGTSGNLDYKETLSNQVIENLAILLKVMYPKLNSGKLPNLNDMFKLLNNFELIEKMCRILEKDEELSSEYENQIEYFKKSFYKGSPNRAEMEKLVSIPLAELDTLLRYPGIKRILCDRENNINFDQVLENGDICLVCTRRGDLGETAHRAFGLFYLLLLQYSVLRRPGNENTRIPHYLYIDEFADFICPATELIFTAYRKYRIGTVISVQNLSQLRSSGTMTDKDSRAIVARREKLGDTILANCSNKIVFGNGSPEDNAYWQVELGGKKAWFNDHTGYNFEEDKYDPKGKAIYRPGVKFWDGTVQGLKFKRCAYKFKNLAGKIDNGTAALDFMPTKYLNHQNVKKYDFTRFSNGIAESSQRAKYTESMYNKFGNVMHRSTSPYDISSSGPITTDESDLAIKSTNYTGDAIYTPSDFNSFNKKNTKKPNSNN